MATTLPSAGDGSSDENRLKLWNDFQRKSKIDSSLRIRQSKIPGAGMGIFTLISIDPGEEILRVYPTANATPDALRESTCDTCLYYNHSDIPTFGSKITSTVLEQGKVILCCAKCKVARYCSKVGSRLYDDGMGRRASEIRAACRWQNRADAATCVQSRLRLLKTRG